MKQSEIITINASAERVWNALTDLEDRVRWNDRLHEMSTLDGKDLAPGSRMLSKVDKSRFKVTVTEFDPPTRMASGAKNPVMTYFHAYDLTEVSEGVTQLTLTGSMGGVLGKLMGTFSKNRMRRDLRDELAPIKEAAESPTG
ncbi:MAG: SRPBCC domain-containing protein [bacterium]|nr:SRPBCC domain-containing protein [bacterium]MDE0601805.1 SRPBCC domain-containing protein [bacterium]